MKVNVQRAFLLRGVRQEPGTEVDLPDHLARELVAANKASPASAFKPVAGPMTTQTAAAVVAGSKPAAKPVAAPAPAVPAKSVTSASKD